MNPSPISLVLVAALSLVAPPARAETPQQKAKALVAKAMKAHEAGDFVQALEHLDAAYAFDPQPDLLYAIAQVYVKLENCPDALSYYERFLATNPADDARKDTIEAIDACNEKLGITTEPAPIPVPVNPPPPVTPPPPPPPPPPSFSPWYKDPLGTGLVLGGVVASVVGIVMYTGARSDASDAAMAPDHAQYRERLDDAASDRNMAAVVIGAGIALIGGGVARLALRDRGTETRVAVVPTDGGGLVTWGGGF